MITPMKKDAKNDDGDNRPVSLKCKVCKILAQVVELKYTPVRFTI